ncbi:hypothetical protein [Streptomyces sp. NPDC019937]|uniref:hypothetical protein n=1 Tax=Streptomyces sp. NPDC019937 TaxID=3154787 RepID=UPI0033FE4AD2
MRAFWGKGRRKAAARPVARGTAWSRFLDHAMDCPGCRAGERCDFGDQLHRAVREAVTAAAP